MEWISVKEKLPKQGQKILVWANKVYGELGYKVNEPSCVKVMFDTSLEYSSAVDCEYYDVFATGITHWMPLPKAPK